MDAAFDKNRILSLFQQLNNQLEKDDLKGEIYLVGGAVMCLVFNTRAATKDVDGYFQPSPIIRRAAADIARKNGIPVDWLNDGVKGYLSAQGEYDPYLSLSHLTIFAAQPEYLFAMKCLAMRIGEEFYDEEDVRFLIRYLNLEHYDQAAAIMRKYYPLERFPQKTLYALESIFAERGK